jgi:hypothetical protein
MSPSRRLAAILAADRAGYPRLTGKKVEEGMVGFVNVKTDYRARATTVRFSSRET